MNPRYNDRFVPEDVAMKMNLLLKRILNGQIVVKGRPCFILISSQNICFGYLLELPH